MYTVTPYPEEATRYVVIHRFGGPREWLTIEEFTSRYTLQFIREQVSYMFDDPIKVIDEHGSGLRWNPIEKTCDYDRPERSHYEPCEFIIRDTYGNKLTKHEMEPFFYEAYREHYRNKNQRQGRKTNWCYGRYRTLNSSNERRSAWVNEDDGEPAIRGARNANNLPNSWDDDSSQDAEKSWKKQSKRRHQWRPKIV